MAVPTSSACHSSGVPIASARPTHVGELQLVNTNDGKVLSARRIHVGQNLLIGRDRGKCQWVFDDPQLSARHLRVYTVVYDNEDEGQLEQLVFAEDLSRNGTFWNGSLIGKGNGGYLLSHNDKLRLSSRTSFRFHSPALLGDQECHFDLMQETEMVRFRFEYVVTDRLLGAGAFGKVFMAINQRTRTQVACKIVDLRRLKCIKSRYFITPTKPAWASLERKQFQTKKVQRCAETQSKESELEAKLKEYGREFEILSQLSHVSLLLPYTCRVANLLWPNIIGLNKVYTTENTMYIFQDLITAGDLFSYLESKDGRLTEVETAVVIRQILIALEYLHSKGIVHRDLKPENIMMTSLSEGCRIVLTDFGAARQLWSQKRMTSAVGSEQYAAPEVKLPPAKNQKVQKGYTKAVDMWSVGAITAVLLTGGSAFTDPSTGCYSGALARTGNLSQLEKSTEWRQVGPRPKHFIRSLLVVDQEQRMTASQALQDIWFSNDWHKTDFEELYQRTIKGWHPRLVKSSVVDISHEALTRRLAPRSVAELQKRRRRDKKPVEPTYKPFSFRMYIPLWPERKSPSQVMSEEAKKAIAEMWTGPPVRKSPRFDPLAVSMKREPARSVSLPARAMPPPSLPESPLQRLDNTTKVSLRSSITSLPSQHAGSAGWKDGGKVRSADTQGRRGLRRRPSDMTTRSAMRKRWRNSMFDLQDENVDSGAGVDGSETQPTVHKRCKLTATCLSD